MQKEWEWPCESHNKRQHQCQPLSAVLPTGLCAEQRAGQGPKSKADKCSPGSSMFIGILVCLSQWDELGGKVYSNDTNMAIIPLGRELASPQSWIHRYASSVLAGHHRVMLHWRMYDRYPQPQEMCSLLWYMMQATLLKTSELQLILHNTFCAWG